VITIDTSAWVVYLTVLLKPKIVIPSYNSIINIPFCLYPLLILQHDTGIKHGRVTRSLVLHNDTPGLTPGYWDVEDRTFLSSRPRGE
jgi:hypothetical protein